MRAARHEEPVATLIYRSRETRAIGPRRLSALVDTAARRNRRERVTGCLVYDRGRFLQWLEGPRAGVERIARSIRADARHTDIEILDERREQRRTFGQWSMRLSVDRLEPGWTGADAEPTTPALLHCLRAGGNGLSALLADLSSHAVEAPPAIPSGLDGDIARIAAHALRGEYPPITAWLTEIALDAERPALATARAASAAACHLRAEWDRDAASAEELTVALSMIQIAVRTALDGFRRAFPTRPGRVLLCPPPVETHLLNLALADEVLTEQGWSVDVRCPESWPLFDAAFRETGAGVSVLCTSPVFARTEMVRGAIARLPAGRRVPPMMLGAPAGSACAFSGFVDRVEAGLASAAACC